MVAARPDAAPPAIPDAAPAPPADAAPPAIPDAAVKVRPDAGAKRRPDAGAPARPDAAPGPATMGSLKVGADPWGEVYVDGKKLGNAPNQWPVKTGKHQVVVVFPGPDGEVKKPFTVTVKEGETSSVFADFTP
jgi:hypothetical protein